MAIKRHTMNKISVESILGWGWGWGWDGLIREGLLGVEFCPPPQKGEIEVLTISTAEGDLI